MSATAVLVLGPHRSGTSALTRVLSLLGLELPQGLIGATDDNPHGYWESLDLLEAHTRFFRSFGMEWFDPRPLPEGALDGPAARRLEDELVESVRGQLGETPRYVLKDPRMCLLVPLWLRVLARVDAEPHFVLAVRNPLEVAASLLRRHETLTDPVSMLLWLRHELEAEHATRQLPRAVVAYDALLADWRGVAADAGDRLGLTWPLLEENGAAIDAFLSPGPRNALPASLVTDERTGGWVASTYRALQAPEIDTAALDAVRDELARADALHGRLLERERAALAEANEARGHLRTRIATLDAQAAHQTAERERLRERLAAAEADADAARAEAEAAHAEAAHLRTTLVPPPPPRASARQLAAHVARWLSRPHEGLPKLRAYWRLRRNGFDAAGYVRDHPDVARAGVDPLLHYVEHGRREGRRV